MKEKEYEFQKELQRMYDKKEIILCKEVRKCRGEFTGMMVMPLEDDNRIEDFKKGDTVIIVNLEDFNKCQKGIKFIFDGYNNNHSK